MQNPRPISPICSKNSWGVNNSTIDATKLSGCKSRSNPEPLIHWFHNHTSCLRPYGIKLDSSLVAQVTFDTLKAATRLADASGLTIDQDLFKKVSWPIACRAQARELRQRAKFSVHPHLELIRDEKAQTPFDEVEAHLVLESAAANLEETGVRRDWVSAVALHLIGWKPSDIAEALGAKVETIRKRIARSRPTVIIELRKQFTLEVN